ncbi:MAG: hypothetical protein R6V27_03575 [Balneolaceae bacterium]
MSISPIIHQQHDFTVRNNGLRNVNGASAPPKLTVEESSMIEKNFTSDKPIKLYDLQGSVNEHNFSDRGTKIDTRV